MPVIASFRVSRRFLLGSAAAAGLVAATGVRAAGTIKPDAKSALIVVDVQNCFIDGGTLPVKGGAQVVPVINKLAASFRNIVVTQDWHTPGHASFASSPRRQEAVRDHGDALRHPGPVARPLRAGHRRRRSAQGPQAADGVADHPQGPSTRASTATRPSSRPTARP